MRKLLLASLVLIWSSLAGAADRSAKEILTEARRKYRVENAVQTMKMTLVSKSGKERVRELEIKVRRDGDTLSSYTRFLSPSDVAGTQLVLVDLPDQEDDQLLYLPALERVTRIAGKARSGSFMGSDFRYSDFELDTGEGSSQTLLEENDEWWIIETTCGPKDPDTKFVTHISRADSLPRKVEWFDDSGAITRRMTVDQVDMKDGVPVPTISRMEDLKRSTSTQLHITEIDLGVTAEQVPDEVFTAAYMERNG